MLIRQEDWHPAYKKSCFGNPWLSLGGLWETRPNLEKPVKQKMKVSQSVYNDSRNFFTAY